MNKAEIHKKAARAGPVACPGCRKTVFPDEDYQVSVTKRKSIIIWHTRCTNKVWKERNK